MMVSELKVILDGMKDDDKIVFVSPENGKVLNISSEKKEFKPPGREENTWSKIKRLYKEYKILICLILVFFALFAFYNFCYYFQIYI